MACFGVVVGFFLVFGLVLFCFALSMPYLLFLHEDSGAPGHSGARLDTQHGGGRGVHGARVLLRARHRVGQGHVVPASLLPRAVHRLVRRRLGVGGRG